MNSQEIIKRLEGIHQSMTKHPEWASTNALYVKHLMQDILDADAKMMTDLNFEQQRESLGYKNA